MKTWQVYHMDNDRQKVVIRTNLSYEAAVKLWQQCNTHGINFCNYESIKK